MRGRVVRLLVLVALAPVVTMAWGSTGSAAPTQRPEVVDSTTEVATESGTVSPEDPSRLQPSTASPAEREAAARGVAAQRERIAAGVEATAGPQRRSASEPLPRETEVGAETEVASTTHNVANTVASSVGSTLAEPAASNDGTSVLYSGNTYVSTSTNGGATWTNAGVPGGPADASIACCDPDTVYAPQTDTTFNILLYTNATQTNGVVRIFVRNGTVTPVDCTYTIDPAGAANNILPDYPHLAISNGFLYLSSNNIQNGSWVGAQMRRFNLSQMSGCQSTSLSIFTHTGSVGQRIHTPVENATTTMYWGQMDNTTTFRSFSWPESSGSVTQTTHAVTASAFNNPDCRGGTGNFDFIERTTSFSIGGFRMRGATGGGRVTFLWPSSAVGGATQAHLRGISLSTSTLATVAQPVVFNNGFCISYPALSSNPFADLGLSVAAGGRSGGGGAAAQGYIAVDDSSSSGVFFPTIFLTASGTHNRSDGRFGDYFTVRRNSRCANTWVATNFALSGGNTASSHVNARYIEFQSTDDTACPKPK